jgi:hypothetical protein
MVALSASDLLLPLSRIPALLGLLLVALVVVVVLV